MRFRALRMLLLAVFRPGIVQLQTAKSFMRDVSLYQSPMRRKSCEIIEGFELTARRMSIGVLGAVSINRKLN